jgi:K+ transporter
LIHQWRHALPLLAAVFLAVTGGEALYADLGHFGRRAIRSAWIWLVFPGLVLNYLGQAALLAVRPEAAENPFFMLVGPAWVLPLTILATAAAIIASQALISGAFSLTSQAIQLGCLPRMTVHHTSATEKGQIYIPFVNWALMVACVMLVLAFRSSAALAGAYGIAIALTMTVTSLLQTLHQRVLLMHVETLDSPVAADDERLGVEDLGEGIHAVHLRFGFAETPDVPAAMKAHLPPALKYDQGRTTFFLGRETYAVAKDTRGFDRFRLGLFSVLSRNATPATAYFQLPASRVVELGAQLSV